MRSPLSGGITMNIKSIEKKGNQATIVVEIEKELMDKGANAAT